MRRFVLGLLRNQLDEKLDGIRPTRTAALIACVGSLLVSGRLFLTALGRSLDRETSQKHRIKAVDRLLGNPGVHCDLPAFYGALIAILIRRDTAPVIVVDWTEHDKVAVLSATVLHNSRALPIYSEAHPRSKLGNARVQKRFLAQLRDLLPPGATPLILSDAGFQRPWFDAVSDLGWNYIGRIRNRTKYRREKGSDWLSTKALYKVATAKPRDLGVVELRRERPAPVRLVIFKKKAKGRKNVNKRGKRSSRTEVRKCARRACEPWLLATNPSLTLSARAIANLYGARFQIEQSFRDQKSPRLGWAAKDSLSKRPERIAVLYLIAAIAKLACELVGADLEARGEHRGFQANTERRRRTLSLFTLGRLAIQEGMGALTASAFGRALKRLRLLIESPLIPEV